MPNETNKLYEFRDFILDSEKRVLWRGEELVSLPPKVFDTLFVLVDFIRQARTITDKF